jgi:hypothetical protein
LAGKGRQLGCGDHTAPSIRLWTARAKNRIRMMPSAIFYSSVNIRPKKLFFFHLFLRFNIFYSVKKVCGFPVPSRDVTNQSLTGINLIIPGQGVFG